MGGVDLVAILKCGEGATAVSWRNGEDVGGSFTQCGQVGISPSAEGSSIFMVEVEVWDAGGEDLSP